MDRLATIRMYGLTPTGAVSKKKNALIELIRTICDF